jgi:CRP-like cAMP-binding protein
MVMIPPPARECGDDFRELLEASYRQNSLLQLTAGSRVPLLKHNFWLVVRGMVRLGAITIHGDETLLGLAGPNEPFGDPLSAVLAYQATTLVDTDLLCLPASELRRHPRLASAML